MERVQHVVEVRGAVCCSANVHCGIAANLHCGACTANLHCGACTARGRCERGGVLFCTFALWHSSEFALWSVYRTW